MKTRHNHKQTNQFPTEEGSLEKGGLSGKFPKMGSPFYMPKQMPHPKRDLHFASHFALYSHCIEVCELNREKRAHIKCSGMSWASQIVLHVEVFK